MFYSHLLPLHVCGRQLQTRRRKDSRLFSSLKKRRFGCTSKHMESQPKYDTPTTTMCRCNVHDVSLFDMCAEKLEKCGKWRIMKLVLVECAWSLYRYIIASLSYIELNSKSWFVVTCLIIVCDCLDSVVFTHWNMNHSCFIMTRCFILLIFLRKKPISEHLTLSL